MGGSGYTTHKQSHMLEAARRRSYEQGQERLKAIQFPSKIGKSLVLNATGMLSGTFYHSKKHLYPVGYISTRVWFDCKNPNKQASYINEILDQGMTPIFRVTHESGNPVYEGTTPSEPWQLILRETNNECAKLDEPPKAGFINGPAHFGFTNKKVITLLEGLDGMIQCKDYHPAELQKIVKKYKRDDEVQAKWEGDGAFYDAKITKVNSDGTYNVIFYDGVISDSLDLNEIRSRMNENLTKDNIRSHSQSRTKFMNETRRESKRKIVPTKKMQLYDLENTKRQKKRKSSNTSRDQFQNQNMQINKKRGRPPKLNGHKVSIVSGESTTTTEDPRLRAKRSALVRTNKEPNSVVDNGVSRKGNKELIGLERRNSIEILKRSSTDRSSSNTRQQKSEKSKLPQSENYDIFKTSKKSQTLVKEENMFNQNRTGTLSKPTCRIASSQSKPGAKKNENEQSHFKANRKIGIKKMKVADNTTDGSDRMDEIVQNAMEGEDKDSEVDGPLFATEPLTKKERFRKSIAALLGQVLITISTNLNLGMQEFRIYLDCANMYGRIDRDIDESSVYREVLTKLETVFPEWGVSLKRDKVALRRGDAGVYLTVALV